MDKDRKKELQKTATDLEKMVDQAANLPESFEESLPNLKNTNDNEEATYKDFEKLKRNSTKKATDIIKRLVNFYLQDEMAEDLYTIKKISVDVQNLTNCIYQMETSQYIITRTLQEIDSGNGDPRMFKVVSDLQKSNLDILKYYKQYVQLMEVEYENFADSYNKFRKNIEEGGDDIPFSYATDDNGDYIGKRSKDMIQEINDEIDDEDDDEEENIDDENNDFSDLLQKNNPENTSEENYPDPENDDEDDDNNQSSDN